MSINSIVVSGNLVERPELKQTTNGKQVVSYRLAVNDRIKKGEEWVDQAYYFTIITWGGMAKFISEKCDKGTKMSVSGKLTSRSYDNKEGQKVYVTEIVSNNVDISLSKLNNNAQNTGEVSAIDDSLPF